MEDDRDAWRLQLAELYNTDVHNLMGALDVLTPGRASALNASLREIFGLGSAEHDEMGEQSDHSQELEELRSLEAAFVLQQEQGASRRRQDPLMGLIQALLAPSVTSSLNPAEEREMARLRRREQANHRRLEEVVRRRQEEVENGRQQETERRRQQEAERRRQQEAERRRQEETERRRQQETGRRRQEETERWRQQEAERRRHDEAPHPFLTMFELFMNSIMASRNPAMSASQLNDIPTAHHDGDASGGGASSSAQCSICLVDYQRGDEKRILPCAHNFHKHCLDQWMVINATCPVCRRRVL